MQPAQRECIESKLELVVEKLINFDKVLKVSVKKGLLDENDVIELKDEIEPLIERKRKCLVKVLKKEGARFVAGVLNVSNNYDVMAITNGDSKDNQRPANDLVRVRPNQLTGDKFIHELELIEEVKVERATKRYNGLKFDERKFYRMESKVRGYALVLVNQIFPNNPELDTRIGAEKDLSLMTQLLEQMHYVVTSRINETKSEFAETVKQFVGNSDWINADSCIVAISSHGLNEGFYCKDGEIYKIQDLKAAFDHENCDGLRGKPKILFIQACRGSNEDPGVSRDSRDTPRASGPPENYIPSIGDMFVVRATQDGFVSYLNNFYGSWLFYSIADVFMKYACQDEFQDLMNKVFALMMCLKSTKGVYKQAGGELSLNVGWKRIYFNPGL